MQEGAKQVDIIEGTDLQKMDSTLYLDSNLSKSSSQRISMRRSTSSGSLPPPCGVPGLIDYQEAQTRETRDEKEIKVSKEHKKFSIRRLTYLNKPELPYLLLGTLAARAHGVVFPIFGLLLSSAIKIFFEPAHKLRKDSRFWGLRGLMLVVLGICTLVVVPTKREVFVGRSGAVGERLSTDASTVRSLVGDALALIVQNIATVIAGLTIAFTANWLLAIIILLVLPLVGLQGFLQMRFYKGFSADANVMYEEASQVANDAVSSIRTVASFSAEEKVMKMYEQKCEAPVKQGVRIGLVSGAGFGAGSFALFCTYSFCFYIGAVLIQHGKASFGDVFKVFFALTMSAIGVSQTSAMAPDVNKAKYSAASIFGILDSKPEIDSNSEEGTMLASVRGDIEFQHVSFKYPTRPDIQIFKDLCISMPSGKLSWLRQQMGLVSQEPILFNKTIRANIAYKKKGDVTEEEIISATKSANAHNFISGLPQGYDTNVGERGIQMYGGQKQRIATARAILKDPKILLLDEATSALDAESERIVHEALDRVLVNRTTIAVAHRLTTIMGVDTIAVVNNGVISEKGSHDLLMKMKDVVYASLIALHSSSE
ncbi:ABC transporter B family member 9 [Forsythia ovata]|uniref:ABC transporter B family member 9 n=1 Tax=Forsythia ovata TaxID=205694 RepID=A0ABD1S6D0_9LAMI